MCYDISFTVEVRVLSDIFPDLVADDPIEFDSSSDHILGPGLFAHHSIIYRHREDNLPHIRWMQWGIIPHYINDEQALGKFLPKRQHWLNIRAERVLEDTSSYWYKLRNRRCLIPVSGIYEHRQVKGWKKKVPYYVTSCAEPLFLLPGLYCVTDVTDKTTGEITTHRTFGIITREANELMKQIHNSGENRWRMPLFLPKKLAQQWLHADLSEQDYKQILQYEMPADQLSYSPVYTIRSLKERPDGLRKIAAYEWPGLPPLGEANPD